MIDHVGTELNIGDIVIFAYGGNGDDVLYEGTIVEFVEAYSRPHVRIFNSKTKRKVDRPTTSVISIMPIKQVHPENFI